MELYFNNLKVPKVIGFSADRITRGGKTQYNADGDMLIDLVSRKFKLTVHLGILPEAELKKVYEICENVFFDVTFSTPLYGEIKRKFHLAEEPSEVQYCSGEKVFYKAIKLELEEQ